MQKRILYRQEQVCPQSGRIFCGFSAAGSSSHRVEHRRSFTRTKAAAATMAGLTDEDKFVLLETFYLPPPPLNTPIRSLQTRQSIKNGKSLMYSL
jgi:hypothetical protein